MLLSQNSQIILRHAKQFETKKVFFFGNIQDVLPIYLLTDQTKIHFYKYNDYLCFQKKNIKNINIYNTILISKNIIQDCNTIIYYWPKNKKEAEFQLKNALSCLSLNTRVFIVGNNSSGIKSASKILQPWIKLKKIDNAKHSILMTGSIKKTIQFTLHNFFKIHTWNNLYIKSLPGVFGHKKIDEGSKLLASTFSKNMNGKILDMGSGTGFLSVCLLNCSPNVLVTLTDNNVIALKCSQETLKINQFKGQIIASNIYSNIFEKFDLIISNPPFHEDLATNFNTIKTIIFESVQYLKPKGELRFVVNSCFKYDIFLKKIFKHFDIIEKNYKYQVYQTFLN
ncbi:16S rRNA (guanine(1207)-N(2))-methyltransferase RsmC [Buchnera aphidicola (Hyadaphis tataricae)]|uniref:Ribosomal RNA small subunit methyltransferase C n=1 Tax=Buchnera aphidicola (Hyadaphis tataricae) TaxID=1241859 RepID=A0A4D6XZM6_9GAMM|nr:16S rRNA (guanine(1207)-N(2))-methyltransferase RsmC [Buchnera aphidicola]QCI21629.1 16S rRNA (guanine(1207)-N(2))-methyltransferase RsmC [Buchnera aphidicola (Hyadaphis tataricae)]